MTADVRRRAIAATLGFALAAGGASAQAATSPQVAMQPDGTAHLGWLEGHRFGERPGVLTERSWTAGGALTGAQHPSPLRAEVLEYDMAADASGGAMFVWRRRKDKVQVEGRRRNADGSLGPLLALSASTTDTESPRVAMNPAGDAVFAWRRTGSPSSYIHARRLSASGVLGPSLTISATGFTSNQPEVAIDEDGHALVVWVRRDQSTGGEVVQSRRIANNGSLGAVQAVSTSAADADSPQVAFDAAGHALIAWLRYAGEGFYPQIRRRWAAGTQTAIQTLANANGSSASHPRLAVDPAGNAMTVWSRPLGPGANPVVQGRFRATGGSLGATTQLSPDSGTYHAERPQVAMDPNGNAMMVWQLTDPSAAETQEVQARRRSAAGIFSSAEIVSTETAPEIGSSGSARNPRVGLAPDGTATFVWEFDDGDGERVHGRRRGPGGTYRPIVPLETS